MLPLLAVAGWVGPHPWMMYIPAALMGLGLVCFLGALLASRGCGGLVAVTLLMMVLGLTSLYSIAAAQGAATSAIPKEDAPGAAQYRGLLVRAWDSFAIATFLLCLICAFHRFFELEVRDLTADLPLGFLLFDGLGLYWLYCAASHGERLLEESGAIAYPT